MSVTDVLKRRAADLRGRTIDAQEAADIAARLGSGLLPARFLEWLRSHPLVGTEFSLSEEEDESGLGVDMKWLTPAQMIDEMTETWPGIAAAPAGYLAIGSCLDGSGDYYYLKAGTDDDPPLVRIPHEAVGPDDKLIEDRIQIVSPRLSDFLRKAEIG